MGFLPLVSIYPGKRTRASIPLELLSFQGSSLARCQDWQGAGFLHSCFSLSFFFLSLSLSLTEIIDIVRRLARLTTTVGKKRYGAGFLHSFILGEMALMRRRLWRRRTGVQLAILHRFLVVAK